MENSCSHKHIGVMDKLNTVIVLLVLQLVSTMLLLAAVLYGAVRLTEVQRELSRRQQEAKAAIKELKDKLSLYNNSSDREAASCQKLDQLVTQLNRTGSALFDRQLLTLQKVEEISNLATQKLEEMEMLREEAINRLVCFHEGVPSFDSKQVNTERQELVTNLLGNATEEINDRLQQYSIELKDWMKLYFREAFEKLDRTMTSQVSQAYTLMSIIDTELVLC